MEWHKNGIYAVFMQEISMRTENFVVNPRKIRPDDLIQSSGRSVLIVGTNFFCASEVPILAPLFFWMKQNTAPFFVAFLIGY